VREVTVTDPAVEHFPRPPAVITQRFAKGSRCLTAEVRGHFAGYLWLAFDGYEEDGFVCRFELATPARCAWDCDVQFVSAFRMSRAFVRPCYAAIHELPVHGAEWSFLRISTFNSSLMAAHRRIGLHGFFPSPSPALGAAANAGR
jgi:hypothetical protein